jgi:hypothetical protein
VNRAKQQTHGLPGPTGRLSLTSALLRLLAGNLAPGLAAAEAGNASHYRKLSVSYTKVADLAIAAGQSEEAQRLYTQALAIRQGLAEVGNTSYRNDPSVFYGRLDD